MRIACISDTHTKHEAVKIPDCGVLVCAGDITWRGEWDAVEKFASWAVSKAPRVVLVSGNHDWNFAQFPVASAARMKEYGIDYLQDSGVEIGGVKFWGSPWQPEFHNWAFNLPRGMPLAEKWALIPDDTQVLITHGPPKAIRDTVKLGEPLGCGALRKRVDSLPNLRLHVFGHIHDSYGVSLRGQVTYVNASICNECYIPDNEAILYEREDWTRVS